MAVVDIEAARRRLESERARVLEARQNLTDDTSRSMEDAIDEDGNDSHMADSASETLDRGMELSIGDNADHLLESIDSALARSADGHIRELRALRRGDRARSARGAAVGDEVHRVQEARGAGLIHVHAEPEPAHRAGSLQWAGFAAVAVAAAVADQLTKRVIEERIALNESHSVIPGLSITHVQNTGIAFGVLPGTARDRVAAHGRRRGVDARAFRPVRARATRSSRSRWGCSSAGASRTSPTASARAT